MLDHPNLYQDGAVEKVQLWCGRTIDGAAVGQPGQQTQCRSQNFLVYPQGADVQTQCGGCGGREDARLRRTAQRHMGANGAIACERCGNAWFALYEEGGEVQTKCLNDRCGYFLPLGVGK